MSTIVAAIIVGSASMATSLISAGMSNAARIQAKDDETDAENLIEELEKNRQDIINPYENAVDLTGMLSNPMSSLGVATQAAEMQIEQADISLANTLDTIRATGASAGGATALAQAALQSKKSVSASIEQQEAKNEQLRARGEQVLQQQQMSEAIRMQGLDAEGRKFMYGQQELRDMTDLDRAQSQLEGSQMRKSQANTDIANALAAGVEGSSAALLSVKD